MLVTDLWMGRGPETLGPHCGDRVLSFDQFLDELGVSRSVERVFSLVDGIGLHLTRGCNVLSLTSRKGDNVDIQTGVIVTAFEDCRTCGMAAVAHQLFRSVTSKVP